MISYNFDINLSLIQTSTRGYNDASSCVVYNFSNSFSFVFNFRKKGVTDGPTDGRTDGWTYPLIEMRGRI